MNNQTKFEEFCDFLDEYAQFLESMVQSEKTKLECLLTNELKRIEHSVSSQQAVSMRIENYEKRRQQMQIQAGFEHATLREIINQVDSEDQQKLRTIFARMQKAAQEVKFLNEKSMKIVQTNLQLLHTITPPEKQVSDQGYSQHGKQADWKNNGLLFETKI